MNRQKFFVSLVFTAAFFATTCIVSPALYAKATMAVAYFGHIDDNTPVSPVGGNTGTTLGEQRRNVFLAALGQWSQVLNSSVEILVFAGFDSLPAGVIGAGGPTALFKDFPGAPVANTWYVSALADALAGMDLGGSRFGEDIDLQFNSDFPSFYLGLDGNPPPGTFDLLSFVLHELAHGLGFYTAVDLATGAKSAGSDDAYMRFLENHGATPPLYPDMTDAQRLAASIAAPNLHWVGANVITAGSSLTAGVGPNGHVEMFAPNPQQPGLSVSHFSTSLQPDELMEPIIGAGEARHDLTLTTALLNDTGWELIGPTTTLAAAVLPSSRAVQIGIPATFMATVINTGPVTAHKVGIAFKFPDQLPGPPDFRYQATDANGVLVGSANTPVDIPSGGMQNFVFGITPSVTFFARDIAFNFTGTNTIPAPTFANVNTVSLSATALPAPDIVALAATLCNDGIVNIPPSPPFAGAFSVATVNLGAGGVTIQAEVGGVGSPSICQTNPVTGVCLTGPSSFLNSLTIGPGETPTFAVFVSSSSVIPFEPETLRVAVSFNGVVATSVAVRTHDPACGP